ncbi:THAP domain-containing protein 5 [Lissotriton helveticus]
MKRGSWSPSKHHFLCSDHFTLDSFDVRWGIRYLKQNAVPTIFSFPQNLQEQESLSQVLKKMKPAVGEERHAAAESRSGSDPCAQAENFDMLVKGDTKGGIASKGNTEKVSFAVEKSIDVCLQETSLLMKIIPSRDKNANLRELPEHFLNTEAETEKSDGFDLEIETELSNVSSTENNQSDFKESLSTVQQCNINSLQMDVFTHTADPILKNKESIITILLPIDCSADPSLITHSLVSAEHFIAVENQEFDDSANHDIDSDAEVLQIEHSYCRQDFDREDLWQKISKLNAKIAFLEGQENNTLSRLKSLEALIGKLREENLLSDEKLKIVENCFTSYEVTRT